MDGMIQVNGLLGILILLVTVGLLSLIGLVCIVFILYRKVGKRSVSVRSISLLFSSVILLLFDGIFYLSLENTLTRETGAVLDQRMLTVWIPTHLIAFVLLYFLFLRLSKRAWN